METSGQPKYDSTSMGGGKMKQLKITKRQAALMLLELCHGFLILFAIYACAVVISGHGSEPFVLVGCLLFPLNAGLFLAEKKATHFWQFGPCQGVVNFHMRILPKWLITVPPDESDPPPPPRVGRSAPAPVRRFGIPAGKAPGPPGRECAPDPAPRFWRRCAAPPGQERPRPPIRPG